MLELEQIEDLTESTAQTGDESHVVFHLSYFKF
jgi:hypothetical protein